MARPGFRNHPKFMRLCRLLGMPPAHVFGHVEYLWSVAYENGEPVIGDAMAVELSAGWVGEPGAFVRALLECGGPRRPGLIEPVESEDGFFQIHDLHDHAPDYVRARWRMEAYRKRKRNDKLHDVTQPLRNGYGSPAPAPAPAPKEREADKPPAPSVVKQKREAFVPPTVDEVAAYCAERGNGIDPEGFVAFYESKGWMVGKNRMKDWRGAVKTWESRRREEGDGRNEPEPRHLEIL